MLLTTIEEMHLLSKKIFFNSLSLHASKLLDKVCLKNSLHTYSSAKYVGLQKADFRVAFLSFSHQEILCSVIWETWSVLYWEVIPKLIYFALHTSASCVNQHTCQSQALSILFSNLLLHSSYHFYRTGTHNKSSLGWAVWRRGRTWLAIIGIMVSFFPLFSLKLGRSLKDCCWHIVNCNFFSPIWNLLDFMFA